MFNTFLRNRARTLTTVLILSILLTAATAFAATEFIKARKGGIVDIASGVKLEIVRRGLAADAYVSGEMYEEKGKGKKIGKDIYFGFEARDDEGYDVELTKPALLYVSQELLKGLKDTTLYGENGEEIVPEKSGKKFVYGLDHFSLYYYRRR